ncbi:hypothetical protein HYFRA_00010537 [Hymenoscyphus fraxineus]|uniref:Dimethylallyl tryptophan synthase n=1 Tax=Hymenoscyphus fraxineus TaxID=746836 RepID=A0A9N9L5W6_9HELO|nr:hypothetical protein HYFRA_00010537 [Hymenoscyphus fraxineus]
MEHQIVSPDLDPNALFWWNSTSEVLRKLLSFGDYDDHQRREALAFYLEFVVPSLGPSPTLDGKPSKWKSFMTDDHTPIEYSWAWGNSEGVVGRRIRFSMEAISEKSGTETDPWNKTATFALVKRLGTYIPDSDFGWFHWLSEQFIPSTECFQGDSSWLGPAKHRSSLFLAFELGDGAPIVKSYMLPFAKQARTGKSSRAAITEILSTLECREQWPTLPKLLKLWEEQSAPFDLEPFMIAIDCVAPINSRMKVYARTPHTSLGEVQSIMSIFEDKSKIIKGLEELSELWRLIFSLPENDRKGEYDKQLPSSDHDTSGILFYFEVRPENCKITTKVYLPVRHYGRNDLSVANGLQAFLQKRGVLQKKFAGHFLTALHQICTHRRLEDATGLQTYVSCKIDRESLDITSYLNPEIYNRSH